MSLSLLMDIFWIPQVTDFSVLIQYHYSAVWRQIKAADPVQFSFAVQVLKFFSDLLPKPPNRSYSSHLNGPSILPEVSPA
jgi:hypothetical protein